MSAYGRLWQKCVDVRDQIKAMHPTFSSTSLVTAKVQLQSLTRLIERWEKIEDDMKNAPDE